MTKDNINTLSVIVGAIGGLWLGTAALHYLDETWLSFPAFVTGAVLGFLLIASLSIALLKRLK